MDTRICNKCQIEYPLMKEHFYVAKKGVAGLTRICKKCTYENNKYTDRARAKKHYLDNREHKLAYIKQHTEANKENYQQYQKQYRDNHKDETRIYNKRYNGVNFQRIRVKKKQYQEQNRDKFREWEKERLPIRRIQMRDYYAKNKARFNVYKERRRAKKAELESTFTHAEWNKCIHHFDNCCAYCGNKAENLHQEHFIALSRGGEYTINNIVPACQSCNSSKRDFDFFEWYAKKKFFSKKREQKLLNYLCYKENIQQLALTL